MSVIHCAFTCSIYYIPTANAMVFTTTHKNTTLHVISSSNTKYFARMSLAALCLFSSNYIPRPNRTIPGRGKQLVAFRTATRTPHGISVAIQRFKQFEMFLGHVIKKRCWIEVLDIDRLIVWCGGPWAEIRSGLCSNFGISPGNCKITSYFEPFTYFAPTTTLLTVFTSMKRCSTRRHLWLLTLNYPHHQLCVTRGCCSTLDQRLET